MLEGYFSVSSAVLHLGFPFFGVPSHPDVSCITNEQSYSGSQNLFIISGRLEK